MQLQGRSGRRSDVSPAQTYVRQISIVVAKESAIVLAFGIEPQGRLLMVDGLLQEATRLCLSLFTQQHGQVAQAYSQLTLITWVRAEIIHQPLPDLHLLASRLHGIAALPA